MDNNKKTDPNAPKTNWQTVSMLIVAALITFILVTGMRGMIDASKTQELTYNEFVKLVDAGNVESISVGNTKITVIPKKGVPGYSREINYFVAVSYTHLDVYKRQGNPSPDARSAARSPAPR